MKNSVLITGCSGGIGASLVDVFLREQYNVIGVDRQPAADSTLKSNFIQMDIGRFGNEPAALRDFAEEVRSLSVEYPLSVVINNAAMQILAPIEELEAEDFVHSMNVNVVAPFLIIKAFLPELTAVKGTVINIGSVHAQATKPHFAAYGTSKAALHGLTRAAAIDLGPAVRVTTLAPAATATPMLKAGFVGNKDAFEALKDLHPLKRIAEPEEIARLALFLASPDASFLTGATIYADGGVLSRLHDPA